MAGGGSPRQKMINMMYLVLTALLALNVSKEVLDAFVIVSEGLEQQKKNIEAKNGFIYGEFENAKATFEKSNPAYYNFKIKPWYDKSLDVKKRADEIVKYLQDMKLEMYKEAQKKDPEDSLLARRIDKKDDYDLPTRYFGTDKPPGTSGRAAELRKKLEDFREYVLKKDLYTYDSPDGKKNLLDMKEKKKEFDKMDKNIRNILNTGKQPDLKTGEPIEWEMFYFFHLPIPAAFTEITKWQNNVRTVEGEITKYFLEQSAGSNFKFDMVQAQIIPKSNVVFAGNQFEAEIFIGAYNSSENPVINVGGARINEFVDGKGIYKTTAQGEGEKTVSGEILVTSPLTGETKSYPFETKYQVSKPMMTVSAEKMNVVYRGLENPMAVSVPGVAPNQITATCAGCESFTGGNGKYVCKPGKDNKININVSVKSGDKTQNMGAAEFRVKRIPDPTIKYIGKKNQETLSIAEASATGGALIPVLEDFDFPLYAKIEGFEVSFTVGGKLIEQTVSGNQVPSNFSDQMRKMDKKKLFFDKIRVRMPDNTVRTTSISFSIR